MLAYFLAALATVLACQAPVPPPILTPHVRAAIERSLPYVEKLGTAWMRERKCNSCHNVTFLVWSHNEAAIGAESLAANRTHLVKLASLPNNGGGPDTLGQILLGRTVPHSDRGEKQSYAAIRSLLIEWQEPDGSWQAQGQLPELKWADE